MPEKLKPCPFCGKGFTLDELFVIGAWWVHCLRGLSGCEVRGPVSYESAEHARELWNKRPQ